MKKRKNFINSKKYEVAPRSCKRLGKNAKVSIMTKYLHPSRLINEVLQNYESNHRLNNCMKVNRHNQLVMVLKHEDFKTNDGEPKKIYAVTRWYKVVEEGPSNLFFDTDNVDERAGSFVSENGEALEVPAITKQINTKGFNEGDIVSLEVQVDLDDDNVAAPENIPTPSNDSGNHSFYSWGHDGVCQCHHVGNQNNEAFLFNISRYNDIPSILQTFEIDFPKVYVEEVIIRETNKKRRTT